MANMKPNPAIGNYCVILHTDGTSEARRLNDKDEVFLESKGFIGCKWLEYITVQKIPHCDAVIEILTNEEAYYDWQHDPTKVNQLATYIYNGGQKPGHYILGNIVFCLSAPDENDEWNFCGMDETLANRIAKYNNEILLPKARETCPVPEVVPDPVVEFVSYDTAEDFVKAMTGDTSVKPASKETLTAKINPTPTDEDGEKEAKDNQ